MVKKDMIQHITQKSKQADIRVYVSFPTNKKCAFGFFELINWDSICINYTYFSNLVVVM